MEDEIKSIKIDNIFIENIDDNSEDNNNQLYISSESPVDKTPGLASNLAISAMPAISAATSGPINTAKPIDKTVIYSATNATGLVDSNKKKTNVNVEVYSNNIVKSKILPLVNTTNTTNTTNIHTPTDGTSIVDNMLKDNTDVNGWDTDANVTIKNWFKMFKQQSFIYQWVLDRNKLISDRLTLASVISSSLLGIFSGFKLWRDNDVVFQTTSNVILMLLNFGVALLTSISKRYIDDKRNEVIKNYIEEIDVFLGEISAQVLKSPVYRMNADDFFKQNNDKYTRLITTAPNLSLTELSLGKQMFQKYCTQLNEVDI